ncbi:hypothetical protein KCTC32516_01583 [Polaribacter huanghezhanensis]|nr:hypothetical protein KCTC32516_01583 [Polaribacter huanghezhanensis]
MGLLRTILFILLFYYGFKMISRYVLPFFLKRFINNVQDRANQQYQKQQQPNVKVGETIIDKKPNTNNQSNNSVGEYVDYEEVE